MSRVLHSIEKVALKVVDRFFLYLERKKRYTYYKQKQYEHCPRPQGKSLLHYMFWFFSMCIVLAISVIVALGVAGDKFIPLTRNAACILKGKVEYCYPTEIEKKKYCFDNYQKICRPDINFKRNNNE